LSRSFRSGFFLTLAAGSTIALAQALFGPPSTEASGQQTAESRVVLVAVTDAQNRTIVDLETDDFQLEEDGAPRDVFEARIADYPVVVLIDNGSGAQDDLATIRAAAARFVARIGERAVAVGTLASPPEMLATFEDDRPTVLARLDKLALRPGPLAPLEALAAATRLIRDVGAPFSAVIVVAAGPIESEAQEPTDLLKPILESRAFINGVGRRPAAATGGDSDLVRDLSARTGGQFTVVFSQPSYAVALDRLADRLAAEFMVEYLVPRGSNPSPDVRVGVKIPGVRVRGMGVSR